MENAGAEEFAELEDVERKGLGTPATRAATIEKLVRSGFVELRDKALSPTPKGMELIKVLPDTIKSVKLTAEWEDMLQQVERGKLFADDFMRGIVDYVTGHVKSYEGVTVGTGSLLSGSGKPIVGKCPRCGKNVVEGRKSFFCEGYHDTPSCGFALWKNDRFFTAKKKELTKKIAPALLENGRAFVTGLYSEKKGKTYDAVVVLDDIGGKYVNFKLEFTAKN